MNPLLKLRGVSPQLTKISGKVNSDVYELCLGLLTAQGYFICEDVTQRAGQLQNRKLVQWKVIVKALEQARESPLLSFSCKDVRDLAAKEFDKPLIRVRKEVLDKLAKHNGHEVAGYGLPLWGERSHVKQRAINTRRSISTGFEHSAQRIETAGRTALSVQQAEDNKHAATKAGEEAIAGLCGIGDGDHPSEA